MTASANHAVKILTKHSLTSLKMSWFVRDQKMGTFPGRQVPINSTWMAFKKRSSWGRWMQWIGNCFATLQESSSCQNLARADQQPSLPLHSQENINKKKKSPFAAHAKGLLHKVWPPPDKQTGEDEARQTQRWGGGGKCSPIVGVAASCAGMEHPQILSWCHLLDWGLSQSGPPPL